MKDGLVETATRSGVRVAGAAAVGVASLQVAGFFGNALYYSGTEPTNGSQTMLAHIGTGMAAYNPMGGHESTWDVVKGNEVTGLFMGGAILAYVAGKKVLRWFSPSQG